MFTGKCDVWADLRNKLPFRDNTVDVFYSYHVIEHLPDLQFHFDEMFRCLKAGGVIRIGGPNGDNAIKKFVENDHNWFSDFPDKRESIGGRFENFIFCRREHLTILTYSFLKELLKTSGFKNIILCNSVIQTHCPNIIGDDVLEKEHESTPDCPHTIIVEATKRIQ
jgi:predicted SAM-dependent methyltransferase